ncbi:MAG: beta-N-acetylhexosaminidase [Maricaulaceae bacterium]
MPIQSTIFGLSGPRLTETEAAFFRDVNPWAFILFARNIETPHQVRRLVNSLRTCVGRDALIFIDQEGGRVQRLRPPHWTNYRPAGDFAALFNDNPSLAKRGVFLTMRLIADDLRSLGITANCAPVLDIPVPGADDIISDRAYGNDPKSVIPLAHAAMAGLACGGVAPVIKHIPGHGRATVDSHKALPRIDTSLQDLELTDFVPFNAFSDAPMAMTAHAVYTALDPDNPVTTSYKGITDFIRTRFGFDGVLMSDDLDMKALSGDLTQLTQDCLSAGCDVALQCSGIFSDMIKVAKGAKALTGASLIRTQLAELYVDTPEIFDRDAAEAELDAMFAKGLA